MIHNEIAMPSPPLPTFPPRAPRVRFAESTTVVLRSNENRCLPARLELVSLTGGLLGLAKPLDRGTTVKLMFLMGKGTVFSVVEMLAPVSWTQQPFRFVTLYDDDKRRLNAEIQSHIESRRQTQTEIQSTRAW